MYHGVAGYCPYGDNLPFNVPSVEIGQEGAAYKPFTINGLQRFTLWQLLKLSPVLTCKLLTCKGFTCPGPQSVELRNNERFSGNFMVVFRVRKLCKSLKIQLNKVVTGVYPQIAQITGFLPGINRRS